jgi:hypothetical protein
MDGAVSGYVMQASVAAMHCVESVVTQAAEQYRVLLATLLLAASVTFRLTKRCVTALGFGARLCCVNLGLHLP